MIIRSKAPLRIGLAGGGTDVSPYSDIYGGAILNATINLYAYASLEPRADKLIRFVIESTGSSIEIPLQNQIECPAEFELFGGVFNEVVKRFNPPLSGFTLTSHIDVPQGSGLGTSSTIVVSLLGAFVEWFKLPLGNYDIAHMAYEIERVNLGLAGGKQDQYAATFGGINFIEFLPQDRVIVNPLNVKPEVIQELEMCLLLYFTKTQRHSAHIIQTQVANLESKDQNTLDAMHSLKQQAVQMKEYLLRGNIDEIGLNLHRGWQSKKKTAGSISNSYIDELYEAAIQAGATGGKISGAGGGGFMFFYCPGLTKNNVAKLLESYGG
ncbi:MAG: hypothetical protein RLZZ46_1529, partial [Bacteroidota bacterium]